MLSGVRRYACMLAAMATLLVARFARADGEPLPVDVYVAAPDAVASRLEEAVAPSEPPLHWVPVPRITAADVLRAPAQEGLERLASVWIDGSRSDLVRLYFVSRTAERFLVRDVPLPTGLDAAALETLAQVVESSIVALISDERVGMTRAEMTVALAPAPVASEPEAAPVPPKPPPWRGALAAFYALEGFATDPAVEHGPGILAAADRRVGRWLAGGWVSAQYVIPMTVDGSLVGVRLDALALRAGPELAWDLQRLSLSVRLGAGGDIVHIAPRPGDSGAAATLSSDRWSWATVAQGAVAAAGDLGGGVSIWGAFFCDVDLVQRHYAVSVDGALQDVVTPWRARPGLMAGVAWP